MESFESKEKGTDINDVRSFYDRKVCPACESGDFRSIYRLSYSDPNFAEYLNDFYSSQGLFEAQLLDREHYDLLLCNNCGVNFQRSVPCDELLERIYEVWINPGFAKKEAGSKPFVFFFTFV